MTSQVVSVFQDVAGRWLCPRSGTVSMAQKAVMLFHNFAVTSDILDLYRLLKEDQVL